MSCVAYGCKNRDAKHRRDGVTFHRFPHKDPHRLKQWVANMKRENWRGPSARSRLCSKHFTVECFDRTGQTVRLRDNAVPTLFEFPSPSKESSLRRVPTSRPVPVLAAATAPTDLQECELSGTDESSAASSSQHGSHHAYASVKSLRKVKRKLNDSCQQLHCLQKKRKLEPRKTRMLRKKCPLARRSCTCGHKFSSKGPAKPQRPERQDSNDIGSRLRRAVRTKRSRPDFFNPSESDNIAKKRTLESDTRKRRRGRPRGSINKPKTEVEKPKEKEVPKPVEEDVYASIPTERSIQYSIVLAELNRKIMGQNFQPS